MIQTALNGMIAVLMARFVLNDVPHAAGLLDNSNSNPGLSQRGYYVTTLGKEALRSPAELAELTLLEQRVLDNLTEGMQRVAQFKEIAGLSWREIEDTLLGLAGRGYVGVRSGTDPNSEKYRLVKRTKLGSLVEIRREGDKAKIEISNIEDIRDISNLLNATGIKWDMSAGISKSAWEGMPQWRRIKRGPMSERAGTYPGQTITFDYADLEKVMEGRILPYLKLESAE